MNPNYSTNKEYEELINELNIAYSHFNCADSNKNIEASIYEINAAKAKIDDYLIKVRIGNG